ncbi:MAG: hypothetical protein ACD_18C00041G0005 [uncultured bacterium]|nr:MAG: hypothetical protein ACD_18C00041G0005 [uncultured bacterium]OGH84161.1 MAG: hypothetical protein A2488_03445 [Candidatus Magasanikbacteria bacterium RIFOXYC12_FULL_32_21b]OGH88235.1 MAG: hypothetical protein A2507_01105 [Candidatus Magasanikbacteria bacterium RIFOXYD12_FULL_33_17]HAO52398.1 hypothetical protein [Candidatus Magasanikbacteria bacterium]
MISRRGKYYYVYIVASINRVIYIGFTDCLWLRVKEHKEGKFDNAFSKRYKTNKLVYWEYYDNCNGAFQRERQIKKWNRNKKVLLIEKNNPNWLDLYNDSMILSSLK